MAVTVGAWETPEGDTPSVAYASLGSPLRESDYPADFNGDGDTNDALTVLTLTLEPPAESPPADYEGTPNNAVRAELNDLLTLPQPPNTDTWQILLNATRACWTTQPARTQQ